ncbi:hypothetical protein MLD52_23210, partial [Puniceicoccaceae bacterium K14]|nr:hypothetical protein [Puniceicoccaceae bacterium K14]
MITSEEKENRVQELKREKADLEREISSLERENSDLQSELAYVRRQMEALKRKLFGSPTSEKVSDEQLQLALSDLEKEKLEQVESEKEVIGYCRRKPKAK